MRILLLSYGMVESDGRLNELIDLSNNCGETITVCCTKDINRANNDKKRLILIKNRYLHIFPYLAFVLRCLHTAFFSGRFDVLFIDNFFAAFPGRLVRLIFHPRFVIQDAKEMYLWRETKRPTDRWFLKQEAKLMQKADLVICANEFRASYMKKYHSLNEMPLVFENIRFLSGEYCKEELDRKYSELFKESIRILSTSGLMFTRRIEPLILSMKRLPSNFGLYIVGVASDADKARFNSLLKENNISNVHFLNKVSLAELRYIIKRSTIGAVHYNTNDLNNLYCASGKIYEFWSEGLPVIATENPPLKRLCEESNAGIADDSFAFGIETIANSIDQYRENVKNFISSVNPEKYKKDMASIIKERIGAKGEKHA